MNGSRFEPPRKSAQITVNYTLIATYISRTRLIIKLILHESVITI